MGYQNQHNGNLSLNSWISFWAMLPGQGVTYRRKILLHLTQKSFDTSREKREVLYPPTHAQPLYLSPYLAWTP
jgi:hypothetical protein